jgi:hypothetical protein
MPRKNLEIDVILLPELLIFWPQSRETSSVTASGKEIKDGETEFPLLSYMFNNCANIWVVAEDVGVETIYMLALQAGHASDQWTSHFSKSC